MGQFAVVALVGLGIAQLAGAIVVISRFQEKKRTEHLQQVATELSFDFRGSDDALLARLGSFPLFSQGSSREMKNVLCGASSDVDVAIFDYRYVTGSGKNSTTHQQTGICFQSDRLALPNFEIRPERWFHKLGTLFGYQDIDIADSPAFSARYLLRGSDEAGVRRLFAGPVVENFETLADICAEGEGNRLIVYRAGKRVQPIEVRQFLETGFGVFAVLARASEEKDCDPSPPAELYREPANAGLAEEF